MHFRHVFSIIGFRDYIAEIDGVSYERETDS